MTGGVALPSQLAYGSPAAKRFKKHVKSRIVNIGAVVLQSQFA